MWPTSGVLQLVVCLYALAPLTSAWPNWAPERDAILVRQDDNKSSAKPSDGPASVSATATSDAATTSTRRSLNTAKPEESNSETGSRSNSDSKSGSDAPTKTDAKSGDATKSGDKPKKTTFGNSIYPGGVKMLTPDPIKTATPLYKIGDTVTLGWNYTDVKAKPTAVDVLLSCKSKSETWTLTANMTYQTKVEYTWDTNDQAKDVENPLGTDMYTLIVKDSEAQITDSPQPGYLNAATNFFTFGLYTGQPYTPYGDWKCNACNSAPASLDAQALRLALAMSFVTLFTFTWFVTGI